MAAPANDYTTYDATGLREDLTDVITNISPTDTWFTSNSGNTRAIGRYHEWQTDALDTPTANAHIEGDTKTASAITATTRLGNYVQILSKEFMITEEMDIVAKAGRGTETAYQLGLKTKSLAMDIEWALLLNTAAVSGASGTARQLKGVLGYITTNVDSGSATGASTTLTTTRITNVLQKIWAAGGKPQHMLCAGFNKKTISALTTSNTKFVMAPEKKVVDSVDVYDTDFGRLAIHLSTIMEGESDWPTAANPTNAQIFVFGDMGLWVKAWLRKVQKKELPIASWSKFWSIEAALTLEGRQEKGSGVIQHNLTA